MIPMWCVIIDCGNNETCRGWWLCVEGGVFEVCLVVVVVDVGRRRSETAW